MRRWNPPFRLAVLVLVVGVVLASTSAGATQQPSAVVASPSATDGDPIRVTECTTIDESGFYQLSRNVTAGDTDTCLRISADDVVLDGAGHHVRNNDNRTDGGIVVRGASNVTVRDVHVSGMTWGIVFREAENGTLLRARADENFRGGVWILESRNVTVRNLTTSGNLLDGLRVHSSRDSLVVRSQLSNNGVGASVSRSSRTMIQSSTMADNQLGAQVMTTRDSRLTTSRMTGNRIGVVLALSDGNVVANNTIRSRDEGLRLESADNNTIRRNVIQNADFGIFLSGSTGNAVNDNRMQTKSVRIEFAFDSDDNRASDNRIRSEGVGLELTLSEGNTIQNNRVRAANGIRIAKSETNTISGNRIEQIETPETINRTTAPTDETPETPAETSPISPGFGVFATVTALLVGGLLAYRAASCRSSDTE